MILFMEGILISFILLITCVIGISQRGPVGMVYFYEKEVQERCIELGLTDRETIKRDMRIVGALINLSIFAGIPLLVYAVNGTRGFLSAFKEMCIIELIAGLFDRLFIDWYWVEHSNAWRIEGTEDLKPYIPKKPLIVKWAATLIVFPLVMALIAFVMDRVLH